ncbi:signal peptide peptidase SppA [Wenzhouxiangella sp. AB-CW3]|uniref:signal peptide peptidase SppA n=1 Tax=Wenzhouxiangella sp. AB-CW3 TaxID=2771012 RepID=UPI00168B160C|nr:signal peptide peptidase SppA [Wenzhouxiangella sp. AB-CW3]QOC21867.1 signal peptide peptidase SppA [Wenzhouxiangella sp. AB-CW3]
MASSRQPNILVRLWLGFWRGLTAFRMAVFNILFLLVLALVLGMVFRGGDQLIIEDDTTLVLSPRGMIVEEYRGTPLERMINEALGQEVPETRLRDLLAGLEQAADDDRITQVLINTDELWGVGTGVMQDLDQAFADFRETGKSVIAYGGFMGQGQYFLASQADEIWLDHEGMVMFEGFGRYRNYYREGLDRIGVEVNLFKTGDYKSAMEPWERSDMSEPDREASEYFLGGLWQDYLDAVAMNRGVPVDVLVDIAGDYSRYLERADGNPARMALDNGLVDRLVSRPELRAEMAQRGAPDDNGDFRRVGFRQFVSGDMPVRRPGTGQVGVIVAEGMIVEGDQPAGTIGSESTSRLIRQAARDDSIEAVVLRVNSGGGSAFASEIIRRELVALRDAGKPVVVSMGNVAASGGYWIAMGANEVWAYPTTITGSIGVVGFLPTFEETLSRIGIHTDGVGTTPLAGALRPDRAMSDEVRQLLDTMINASYREFLGLVAEHREMDVGEVHEVAQGRVWTGTQAMERGLVDHLGNLSDAIASAARIAGLGEDYRVTYVEPELKPWQAFFAGMGARALVAAGFEPGNGLLDALPIETRDGLMRDLRLLTEATRRNGRPGAVAHCLCDSPM